MTKKILLTGAGYIGSHTCIELIQAGFLPVIIDNLSNSSFEADRRVERITGVALPFYEADVQDLVALKEILNWSAELDINRMSEYIWRWQSMSPDDYR